MQLPIPRHQRKWCAGHKGLSKLVLSEETVSPGTVASVSMVGQTSSHEFKITEPTDWMPFVCSVAIFNFSKSWFISN